MPHLCSPYEDVASLLDLGLLAIFLLDMLITFRVGFYDSETGSFISNPYQISQAYLR